jgi:uncharacterized protein (DUF362 family)
MSNESLIALADVVPAKYPDRSPYHPPERYPEYEGGDLQPDNPVYAGVRDVLCRLGLDTAHFGTPAWNPFGEFIRPGMTVFVKPNTVVHVHERGKDIFGVINHASVVRPILDYVCRALKGQGRIILGDCQLYMSDFDKAMDVSGIGQLLGWYRGQTRIPIECFDLRINKGYRTYLYGRWGRRKVEQDPRGYTFVDLADKSCFKGVDPMKLRIAVASHKEMRKHHTETKHEYLFPRSFLESDVVISIPKLKTHRRTAITLALKNFMGIPSLKDSLPHFIVGSPGEGGDQYIHPSLRKRICTWLHDQIQTNPFIPVKFVCAVTKKLVWNSHWIFPFKDDVFEAMWYGNDTLWRTLHDLNRAVLYADRQGVLQPTPQRKLFVLIDGVIGGEGDGPLETDPVHAGVLLGGFNCAAIDAVAATLMGFDVARIPLIHNAFVKDRKDLPLTAGALQGIRVTEPGGVYDLEQLKSRRNLKFAPHPNWVGHVEFGCSQRPSGPSESVDVPKAAPADSRAALRPATGS